MKLSDSIDLVAAMSVDILMASGECEPYLYVFGEERLAAVGIGDFGPTSQDRETSLFMIGQIIAEKNSGETEIGLLEHVILVSEAYMSIRHADDPIKPLPSEDPDHKEILFISGLNPRSEEQRTRIYEILRGVDGKAQDVVSMDIPEDSVPDHSILKAFAMGYYAKKSGVN